MFLFFIYYYFKCQRNMENKNSFLHNFFQLEKQTFCQKMLKDITYCPF